MYFFSTVVLSLLIYRRQTPDDIACQRQSNSVGEIYRYEGGVKAQRPLVKPVTLDADGTSMSSL